MHVLICLGLYCILLSPMDARSPRDVAWTVTTQNLKVVHSDSANIVSWCSWLEERMGNGKFQHSVTFLHVVGTGRSAGQAARHRAALPLRKTSQTLNRESKAKQNREQPVSESAHQDLGPSNVRAEEIRETMQSLAALQWAGALLAWRRVATASCKRIFCVMAFLCIISCVNFTYKTALQVLTENLCPLIFHNLQRALY